MYPVRPMHLIGRRVLAIMLLWLALLATPAAAHRVQSDQPAIHPHVCLLKAEPGMSVAALWRAQQRFDCAGPQNKDGPGDFWVLLRGFSIPNSAIEPVRLRWSSTWQRAVRVYAIRADGSIGMTSIRSGTTSPRIELGAQIALPLPPSDSPIVGILAHVEGAANTRGVMLSPNIEPEAASITRDLALAAGYAACGGVGIALIVYNLMLWSALRLRFLLYYCAMVSATLLYGLSSSGALAWLLPWIDNNDRLRLNYLLLALAGVSAMTFVRHFFEVGVLPTWLRRWIAVTSCAVFATGLGFALFAPHALALLDRLFSLSVLAMLAAMPATIYCAWRARSQFLRLFLIAWSAPFLFAVLRTAHGLGLVPHHFWLDNSTVGAMMIEALISSLAVAYRINALSAERDHARERAQVATALADTDPLTGLRNRRAFLREAIRADGAAVVQQLALIDIDHFKRINDRLGHDAGDEVLTRIAAILTDFSGPNWQVARLGGEEFGLLCRRNDSSGIDAEALMTRVRNALMPHGARVTLSVGIAEGPIDSEADWQQLYRRADIALYRSKQTGRDRCCFWSEALGDEAA